MTTSPASSLSGLLGLGIFEACGANMGDLGEEHGHGRRVLRVHGKGGKGVLIPLPPAVARARPGQSTAVTVVPSCPTPRARMDRHAATRRLKHQAIAGIRMPRRRSHTFRHNFVITMLDAGVNLRDVQIAAATPTPALLMRYDHARRNLDRQPGLSPRHLHGLRHLTAVDQRRCR